MRSDLSRLHWIFSFPSLPLSRLLFTAFPHSSKTSASVLMSNDSPSSSTPTRHPVRFSGVIGPRLSEVVRVELSPLKSSCDVVCIEQQQVVHSAGKVEDARPAAVVGTVTSYNASDYELEERRAVFREASKVQRSAAVAANVTVKPPAQEKPPQGPSLLRYSARPVQRPVQTANRTSTAEAQYRSEPPVSHDERRTQNNGNATVTVIAETAELQPRVEVEAIDDLYWKQACQSAFQKAQSPNEKVRPFATADDEEDDLLRQWMESNS